MSLLDSLTQSLINTYAQKLDEQQRQELIDALDVVAYDLKYNVFKNTFPEKGDFSIHKYPKHKAFFDAGASFKERGFIAGNRTGKTIAGAFETVCHLTGLYPPWWKGYRFNKPVKVWVGGDTATTCRDIIQTKLLGEFHDLGSGMIPKELIIDTKPRRNVPNAIEIITVKHISGGTSTVTLKTYEQGRATWQGTEVDFIWIDEECPEDVYGEALIRTMTTKGRVALTFTPLSGLTQLVLGFLRADQNSEELYKKHVTKVGWGDVPHLSEDEITQMLAATPPNLRDARSKGDPTVGSGLIYPLPLDHVTVADFQIPKYYAKAYGMDVGWNNTAAVFGAWNRDTDVIYVYSEYKQGEAQPIVHAASIKARGSWQRGTIDPASRGRSQIDGQKLWQLYTERGEDKCGLKLIPAPNAREAGIYAVWERLNTGRLKFFKSCTKIQEEFTLYHRDDKGEIVKTNDHLLDSLRYLCMADKSIWQYEPSPQIGQRTIDVSSASMAACV